MLKSIDNDNCGTAGLERLLRRKDVWRGHSQKFVSQDIIDTGFEQLNQLLLHGGWPQGCLIELGQKSFSGAWLLFAQALDELIEKGSDRTLCVLNPPAEPCAVHLLQMHVSLDNVLLLQADNKADFIAAFVELAASPACSMLMAWSPKQRLTYAELRKCQLATRDQAGVYFLFRPAHEIKQNSPAALRLFVHIEAEKIRLDLIKQRGKHPGKSIYLPLPEAYLPELDYPQLLSAKNIETTGSDKEISTHPFRKAEL
jgi:protein ImuA